jgi:hypothetical protein
MDLAKALSSTSLSTPEDFSAVCQHIDPKWIRRALHLTGSATIRRRRLPADRVVWLVLGMALMRNESIVGIVDRLGLALPDASGQSVAPSAVAQARARLGDEPLRHLFEMCAEKWATESADQHRWRGLALYGVDGTVLNVADTVENRATFGAPPIWNGKPGYPQLRLVTLMALRSHLIAAAAIAGYGTHERRLGYPLFAKVPERSLLVIDRGLFAVHELIDHEEAGPDRHWITRAKANHYYEVLRELGSGDRLVAIRTDTKAVARDPRLPKRHVVRAVRYRRPGAEDGVILTSLLDPRAYPAHELAALYHERWEHEMAYDEIKTEMLDARPSLRSQSVSAVRQELWGVLTAFNLVRLEMERVAAQAMVPPTRISFVSVLRLLHSNWDWWGRIRSPGAIPRRIQDLDADFKRCILPPRRTRTYPRATKIRTSMYPKKRDTDAVNNILLK